MGLVDAHVVFFCLCHRLIILKGSVADRGKMAYKSSLNLCALNILFL